MPLAGSLPHGNLQWGIADAFLVTPIMLSLLVLLNTFSPLRAITLSLSDQTTLGDLDRELHEG